MFIISESQYRFQDIPTLSQISMENSKQLAAEKCNRESTFDFEILDFYRYNDMRKFIANSMQISTLK